MDALDVTKFIPPSKHMVMLLAPVQVLFGYLWTLQMGVAEALKGQRDALLEPGG